MSPYLSIFILPSASTLWRPEVAPGFSRSSPSRSACCLQSCKTHLEQGGGDNLQRGVHQVATLLHREVGPWFRPIGRIFEDFRLATKSSKADLDCIREVSNTSRLRRFRLLLQTDRTLPDRISDKRCSHDWSDGTSWRATETASAREVLGWATFKDARIWQNITSQATRWTLIGNMSVP